MANRCDCRSAPAGKGDFMMRCSLKTILLLPVCAAILAAGSLESWQATVLQELSVRYLGPGPEPGAGPEAARRWMDRLAKAIGARLADGGISAIPAEDLAAFAMLHARLNTALELPEESAEAGPPPAEPGVPAPLPARTGEEHIEDIGKGQEGLRQGVEQLRELPLSERMVVTGDVNAGLQYARVPDVSDMSSAFGRFRLNVVARAVPASAGGRRSEGYFFLQLRAAGGPFDSAPVGGPRAFSPFNDIATDRSQFNEGLDRGNFYLGKAYFQQGYRFGKGGRYRMLGQLGVVDFSDFFDTNAFANNEVRQFLNTAFVNAAAYKTAIGAPGMMGEFNANWQRNWLDGVVFRSGYAIARTEKMFQSPTWNGEVELRTLLSGRPGAFRLGGSIGNVADSGGFRTIYFSMDHWLTSDFGVFGRLVVNNQGPGSQVFGPLRSSVSGGVQRRFVNADDYVSAWGLGFSTAWGIDPGNTLRPEHVLETYYRWQITNNFALTPDFQIINGAGGAPGTHVVLGMRANFGF